MPATDIPAHLVCPITHQLMADPVVAEDGITYEREAIEEVYRPLKDGERVVSPMTREEVKAGVLIPNQAIKALCIEFLEAHPEIRNAEDYYLPNASRSALYQAFETNLDDATILEMLDKEPRLLGCALVQGEYPPFYLACSRNKSVVARAILVRLIKHGLVDAVAKMKPARFEVKKCSVVLLHIVIGINGGDFTEAEAEAALTLGASAHWDVYSQKKTLLDWASDHDRKLAAAAWLLSKGLSVKTRNARGQNALHIATAHKCISLIRLYLQFIHDVTEKREIVFALDEEGHSPISELLNVSNYTSDQRRNLIPLFLENAAVASLPVVHVALRLADARLLETVLKQESALKLVEAKDSDGLTPLQHVCNSVTEQSISFAKVLLAHKADPMSGVQLTGENCLHLAVKHHHVAVVELLLANQAEGSALANVEDNVGNTPAHALVKATVNAMTSETDGVRAREAFISCIRCLVENGADISQPDHQGVTPTKFLKNAGYGHLASPIKRAAREFTQKQIAGLQDEVRELRAKVDADESMAQKRRRQM